MEPKIRFKGFEGNGRLLRLEISLLHSPEEPQLLEHLSFMEETFHSFARVKYMKVKQSFF